MLLQSCLNHCWWVQMCPQSICFEACFVFVFSPFYVLFCPPGYSNSNFRATQHQITDTLIPTELFKQQVQLEPGLGRNYGYIYVFKDQSVSFFAFHIFQSMTVVYTFCVQSPHSKSLLHLRQYEQGISDILWEQIPFSLWFFFWIDVSLYTHLNNNK